MAGEIHFNFGNLQYILFSLLIVGISIYFYLELKKIKQAISDIQNQRNILNTRLNQFTEKIPDNLFPDKKLPEKQFTEKIPEKQYLEKQFTEKIPEKQYPENQYPENQYPEKQFQEEQYPEKQFQEEQLSERNEFNELNELNELMKDSSDTLMKDTMNELIQHKNNSNNIIRTESDNISLSENDNNSESGIKNIKTDYSTYTVSELKKILIELNLPTSGNKKKLIKRIEENNSLQL